MTQHTSHQTNGNITLHPRVEIYLDFQIQLDLDLQTARLGPIGRWAVQDARLAHGRDAAAFLLRLRAHGHELLLQGLVLLLQGLLLRGGLGACGLLVLLLLGGLFLLG